MELIDNSAEDIFSPTASNGLNGLFNQPNSNSSENLKYQAPKKTIEEKPKNASNTSKPTFMVNAHAWDGKSYKPIGKVRLTIISKDGTSLMVLYKSKQQTFSTIDLSQEPMKIEYQSENVLGTLDQQVVPTVIFMSYLTARTKSGVVLEVL